MLRNWCRKLSAPTCWRRWKARAEFASARRRCWECATAHSVTTRKNIESERRQRICVAPVPGLRPQGKEKCIANQKGDRNHQARGGGSRILEEISRIPERWAALRDSGS